VVDAHALCLALVERVRALGGHARFGTRVTGFAPGPRGVHAVMSTQGDIACRAVVLAAGAQSAQLAQWLGEYLPVYPIRGYSLTLPMSQHTQAPTVSVTDLGRKTVFAPLGSVLRVAAVAEIGGYGLRSAPALIEQMRAAVAALYPGRIDAHAHGHPWVGLRPATPTSVPIVRRMKRHANAYLNVGHGALGLTLAAGSAAVLERALRGA
jgi:D-amino-acid dehydrogenase